MSENPTRDKLLAELASELVTLGLRARLNQFRTSRTPNNKKPRTASDADRGSVIGSENVADRNAEPKKQVN